jgi:hypothetical protein
MMPSMTCSCNKNQKCFYFCCFAHFTFSLISGAAKVRKSLNTSSSYKMRLLLLVAALIPFLVDSFMPVAWPINRRSAVVVQSLPDFELPEEKESALFQQKAAELREQIRSMEAQLEAKRRRASPPAPLLQFENDDASMTLRNKRVFVVGANGRLGSMVCRYLLRNHPHTQVVAGVHVVGQVSTRGYGRLSYEVGAEDGIGTIGAAWNSNDRVASFQYDATTMNEYNLQNIRVVECELLDPIQCQSVVEGCDAVLWCATDFNGNTPRAVSGLNAAFLFRAIASPDKGRVEIEGLKNMLGALKLAKQDKQRKNTVSGGGKQLDNDPINFVLVSTAPEAFQDFETPFGSFNGLKRQGEDILKNDFSSFTWTILQLNRFEDNFVGEGLDVQLDFTQNTDNSRRRINRRDAAKAVVDALLNEELIGNTVQVWTDPTQNFR